MKKRIVALFAFIALILSVLGACDKTTVNNNSSLPEITNASSQPKHNRPTQRVKTADNKNNSTSNKTTGNKNGTVNNSTDNKNNSSDSPAVENNSSSLPTKGIKTVVGSRSYPNTWIYQNVDNGIMMRDYVFDSGKGGEPVIIAQTSDYHINKINDADKSNATVMGSYNARTWLKNGASLPIIKKTLSYASSWADQIVVTGDTIDYLSYGALELLKSEIFNKYPGIMVANGNHDFMQKVGTNVPECLSIDQRYSMMQSYWAHDIKYSSKVIKNKVMAIQIDNGQAKFLEEQVSKLTDDIAKARQNGYSVLIFCHEALCTSNPAEKSLAPVRTNDSTSGKINLYDGYGVGRKKDDSVTNSVISLITNNGDIIKGVFCGHEHSDYYSEIIAKTPTGKSTVIPQIIMTGSIYDGGHITKITVK